MCYTNSNKGYSNQKGNIHMLFKFLSPSGETYYQDKSFAYTLPKPDQKWSDATMHPNPSNPDGLSCGAGRLHLMKSLDASYAPANWWPWGARGVLLLIIL
jgi:hypothetical protein